MKTVIGSSLVLLTSLLMPFAVSKDPVVHLHGLTGTAKGHLWKQTWPSIAMCLGFLGSARVKCSAIKQIWVLVQFGSIFTNPVTYVTGAGKTGLIYTKYTCSYYGTYLLFFMCYLKSVNFIKFLMDFCICDCLSKNPTCSHTNWNPFYCPRW